MTKRSMAAVLDDLDLVPDALFQGVPFQSSRAWWECVAATGLPAGGTPAFMLAADATGLLPLLRQRRELSGLVTPYTCLFQPLLGQRADPEAVGRAWGRALPGAVLQLYALDPAWPAWPGLLRGFARAGWQGAWFDTFGNWHEPVADWASYLAARPGALRETVRRRLGRAERDPAMRFDLVRDDDGPGDGKLAAALDAYDTVYARSWKEPEPYPRFGRVFVTAAAAAGVLRFGVLRRDGAPLAAQYWTVERGVATVLKLAHDEAARQHSPGTVLTAWMVRELLAEGVSELDFGRGDDPYKRDWASGRRQRRGLLLARAWRPAGAAALLRQHFGALRRRVRGD